MRAELIGAYDNASRLDNPPLLPAELRPPGRCLLRRVRGPGGRGGWGLPAARRRRGGNQADVRAPGGPLAGRGGGAPAHARGGGRGPGLRSAPASTPAPSRCTPSASTAPPGTSRSRPTTTIPSPASGERSGWSEAAGPAARCSRAGLHSDAPNEEPDVMSGPAAVGDDARPPEEDRLPFRQRWAWTLQMNRPMASPFIGLVCAVSIGGPLAVGIATGYPRAGGWAAVGCLLHGHGGLPARPPFPGQDRGRDRRAGGDRGLPGRVVRHPRHRHLSRSWPCAPSGRDCSWSWARRPR